MASGGFGNFYTMKRGGHVTSSNPVMAALYKQFVQDNLDILEKMEKIEEIKYNVQNLVSKKNLTKTGLTSFYYSDSTQA